MVAIRSCTYWFNQVTAPCSLIYLPVILTHYIHFDQCLVIVFRLAYFIPQQTYICIQQLSQLPQSILLHSALPISLPTSSSSLHDSSLQPTLDYLPHCCVNTLSTNPVSTNSFYQLFAFNTIKATATPPVGTVYSIFYLAAYKDNNILRGSSMSSLIVLKNVTASRPSNTLWSYVNARYIMGLDTI